MNLTDYTPEQRQRWLPSEWVELGVKGMSTANSNAWYNERITTAQHRALRARIDALPARTFATQQEKAAWLREQEHELGIR